MSEWKEFFEKHQDSNVEIANKGWRGKINIEDLYQALKARLIDEVSIGRFGKLKDKAVIKRWTRSCKG